MAKLYNTEEAVPTAILVGADFTDREKIEASLVELKGLADTAGVEAVAFLSQVLKERTAATYIGSGKTQELIDMVKTLNVDMVIFDNELLGSQINNLEELTGVKVIDRSMLILDIFAGRAKTNEGKLQVELAQLKYSLPRINALSGSSGRFGSGGVGMRGPGETKLELNKRIARDKVVALEREIEKLASQRNLIRNKRIRNREKMVAIVGYTNAGKSTLLNTMAKADIYADDKLFATLDTTTRNIFVDYKTKFLLTDTVGFINKLPHEFIEAFKSTLEEAKNADVILHVVDVTNPDYQKHIEVVNDVLGKIGAADIPILMVYNKVDKLEDKSSLDSSIMQISAKKAIGVEELKQKLVEMLFNEI